MPNWVYHRTTVSGPKADLERFEKEVISEGDETYHNYRTGQEDTRHYRILDFDKIAPAPEGFNMELTSPVQPEVQLIDPSLRETRYLPWTDPREYAWVPEEAKKLDDEHLAAWMVVQRAGDRDKRPAEERALDALAKVRAEAAAYKKNLELTGCLTWYELNCKRFGTKWGACDCEIGAIEDLGDGNASMKVNFDTAWSMPDPIWAVLFERFPTLHWKGSVDEEGGFFHAYIDGREWDVRDGVSPERQAENDRLDAEEAAEEAAAAAEENGE